MAHCRFNLVAPLILGAAAILPPTLVTAEQVPVRHSEGLVHGFLALRTLEGKRLADGDMTQEAKGGRVTNHLVFRFKDGSIYDETTIFSEHDVFRLLTDHLVQRGPSFKRAMDTLLDASTGQITVRYTNERGKEEVLNERLDLPDDVANGLLLTLVKDIQPSASKTVVSMVVTTPKPRLVKVEIVPQHKEAITSGDTSHQTVRYDMKIKIGGLAGTLARLVGKQPPEMRVWVLVGMAPAFVKWEGPLYDGGPIWRVELALPAAFAARGSR